MAATTGDEDAGGDCDATCVHQTAVQNAKARRCNVCDAVLFGPTATFDLDAGTPMFTNSTGLLGLTTFAAGVIGDPLSVFTGFHHNTVTYSADLIVSTDPNPDPYVWEHELGHVSQARQYGLAYLPYYIATVPLAPGVFLAANATGHRVSLHDAVPLERDAEIRAGHGDPWRR